MKTTTLISSLKDISSHSYYKNRLQAIRQELHVLEISKEYIDENKYVDHLDHSNHANINEKVTKPDENSSFFNELKKQFRQRK